MYVDLQDNMNSSQSDIRVATIPTHATKQDMKDTVRLGVRVVLEIMPVEMLGEISGVMPRLRIIAA